MVVHPFGCYLFMLVLEDRLSQPRYLHNGHLAECRQRHAVPALPPFSCLPSPTPQNLKVWAFHMRQVQMLSSRNKAELQWDLAETSKTCQSIIPTATLSAMLPINSYKMRILKHCWKHFIFTDEKCSRFCSAEWKNPESQTVLNCQSLPTASF